MQLGLGTYSETMVTLLELMKSRKTKMPSVPWDTRCFENKYREAMTFWSDYRRSCVRKTLERPL